MQSKKKRRTLLIDRQVQLALVFKLCTHWVALLICTMFLLPFFRYLVFGDIGKPMEHRLREFSIDAVILGGIFILLLPAFTYDTLRLTNRFAGPIYRLQSWIRNVDANTAYRPIRFRKGDFWHDVADDFNKMIARLKTESDDAGTHAEDVADEPASAAH